MHPKYSIASKFRKPLSIDGLYYSHGLMCASYPRTVVAVVMLVVIVCSLPFFITPSGDLNKPKPWHSPWLNFRIMTTHLQAGKMGGDELEWIIDKPSQSSGRTPSWFVGLPVAVVQQLYVNLDINCQQMKELCDKSYYFTSKLAATHLLSNMEHATSACHSVMHPAALNLTRILSLDNPPLSSHAPHPPSGVLSPVLDSFRTKWEAMPLDYHSIKELVYGGFWEHSLVTIGSSEHKRGQPASSSTPERNSQYQHHSFAVSFLIRAKGREDFNELVKCVEELKNVWPDEDEKKGTLKFMKHFYYELEWSLLDFAPLMAVYGIVFLYISFSVGKIDLVKSKYGLGFTAFIQVVAALTMSLGICTFFGLSISLSGSEIYPYVVITIGLENILIIVKAVMSTPDELEVKYRIAIGLSNEGRAITRNLITLVAMTTTGIIFLNYMLKEFCIIALVGIMSDAFLQLVFFPTVMFIDLRRMELSDLNSVPVPVPDNTEKSDSHPTAYCRPRCPSSLQMATPMRWHSKRVKFNYFLARTRIVSRFIMLGFLILLSALFVKTGTFHNLFSYFHSSVSSSHLNPGGLDINNPPGAVRGSMATDSINSTISPYVESNNHTFKGRDSSENSGAYWEELLSSLNHSNIMISRRQEDGFTVTCENGDVCWRPMVTTHWPRLLTYCGFNMDGKFLTLLPPINLDFILGVSTKTPSLPTPLTHFLSHSYFMRVTFIMVVTGILVCYFLYLIRSSRFRHERYMRLVRMKGYNRIACLKGHRQDIDYMCVSDGLVVTTGLDGDIRVWDVHPMKRRCARIIARSELCREPPPEVSSSSHRPAAEGCEASESSMRVNKKYTAWTNAPTLAKSCINNNQRESNISTTSRTSSTSDNYDWNRAQSGSRLSNMSDVASLDVASLDHHQLTTTQQTLRTESSSPCSEARHTPINHATPIPASSVVHTVPIRNFSSQSSDVGNVAIYSSPGSLGNMKSIPPHHGGTVSLNSGWKSYFDRKNVSLSSSSSPPDLNAPGCVNSTVPSVHNGGHSNNGRSSGFLHLPDNGVVSLSSSTSSSSLPSSYQTLNRPLSSCSHIYAGFSQAIPSLSRPLSSSPSFSVSQVTQKPFSSSSFSLPQSSVHCSPAPQPSTQYSPHPLPSSDSTAQCTPGQASLQVLPAATVSTSHLPTEPLSRVHVNVQLEPENSISYNQLGAISQTDSTDRAVEYSVNYPESKSNPLVSMGHKHFPNSSGTLKSDVPSIQVNKTLVKDSTPPNFRDGSKKLTRMGHSRHLSLGNNIPRQLPSHSRNRSLGSINASQIFPSATLNSTQGSCSNLSLMSNASTYGSQLSINLNFMHTSHVPKTPDPDNGYDFAQHFNLFSQYTSNIALEYCLGERNSEEQGPTVPPVWCMAFMKRVVAIGCGNGQVEAWNASTGSLVFSMNMGNIGICAIAMSSAGIVTGQMDGTLNLIGYNGLLHQSVPAHDKAISVLQWYGDNIITGGYDSAVKVHRNSTSLNGLVCVNSVFVHEGNISALAVVESQLKLGCVSGCSKGLVIHWDINTGNCINEFGMYNDSTVLQLESTVSYVVGLFDEGCMRVWNVVDGALVHTIVLDGVCYNFTVLSSQHIALSSECHVELYCLENGKPHSEKRLETEKGVSIVRHIQALDGASVVCSNGRDIYIVPCDLKLKTD